jgi:hypothetical protein
MKFQELVVYLGHKQGRVEVAQLQGPSHEEKGI